MLCISNATPLLVDSKEMSSPFFLAAGKAYMYGCVLTYFVLIRENWFLPLVALESQKRESKFLHLQHPNARRESGDRIMKRKMKWNELGRSNLSLV